MSSYNIQHEPLCKIKHYGNANYFLPENKGRLFFPSLPNQNIIVPKNTIVVFDTENIPFDIKPYVPHSKSLIGFFRYQFSISLLGQVSVWDKILVKAIDYIAILESLRKDSIYKNTNTRNLLKVFGSKYTPELALSICKHINHQIAIETIQSLSPQEVFWVPYDVLLNLKTVEFKDSITHQKNLKYFYHPRLPRYVLELKKIHYNNNMSTEMIFVEIFDGL